MFAGDKRAEIIMESNYIISKVMEKEETVLRKFLSLSLFLFLFLDLHIETIIRDTIVIKHVCFTLCQRSAVQLNAESEREEGSACVSGVRD